MNYILLDLEWNNSYFHKIHSPFNEIVEIGAVKLDENFQEIDRFNAIIRSSLTKKLSGRFKELTGMSNETMLEGIKFSEALGQYKNWAGEDCITLTWSNTDLYVLYDNCEHFTSGTENAQIGLYADLQAYFHYELALMGKPEKNQISLSNAAMLFGINFDDSNLHRAVDDSAISAAILKKCYKRENFKQFIFDTNNPNFYKKLRFKSYYINNLKSEFVDKKQMYIKCPDCSNRVKRLTKWRYKNKWFSSTFLCENCDKKLIGFISFRRLFDRIEIKKKAKFISNAQIKTDIKQKDKCIKNKATF